MSSTFSNLKFELIGNGEQSGTWGTTTNTNIGTAIEQAVVGMATLDSGDFTANVATLTLANTNAAQDARALCLNIASGAVSAAGTINVPAIQKPYIIINGSSYTVTVKVSGQTGVAVPAGKRTVVYNNGTDVGSQINWLAALDITTLNATTVDATNVEVTNVKAKDGTAGMSIADSTGVVSFTANPILSGGTANGVVYANGSKVLTTGSALTFDGTTITSTGGSLYLNGTNSDTAMTGSYVRFGTNIGLQSNAANSALVAKMFNGSTFADALTLNTSGNLGLGVTPSVFGGLSGYRMLEVGAAGSGILAGNNDTNVVSTAYYNSGWKYASSNPAARYSQNNGIHAWYTAPSGTAGNAISFTQAMTLDANGDLAVGSLFADSRFKVEQAGVAGLRIAFNNASQNFYDADLQVFRSGNGTERARIDSSGNVGIGTSSPTQKLDITGNAAVSGQIMAGSTTVYGDGSIGTPRLQWNARAGTYVGAISIADTSSQLAHWVLRNTNGNIGDIGTSGTSLVISTANTERMRIDSSGNVGIGTSSPTQLLDVTANSGNVSARVRNNNGIVDFYALSAGDGALFAQSAGKSLLLGTVGTERARITAAGALLVGTTANNGEKVRFSLGSVSPATSGNMTTGAIFQGGDGDRALNLATDASGVWYNSGFANNAGVAGVHRWLVGGTERMSLSTTGIVTMSAYGAGAATFSAAGVISSVSDETWKTKDGAPVDPDAMLKKLEPGYWYYNDEKKPIFGAERQLGFYAQNVNAAIGPEAAPTPEEGKPWGYYDRSVLAVVVMSLQKALATIESLEDRIATLESKP